MIASTGKGTRGREQGRHTADALRARGFDVCRGWVRTCPLEGRTNVQGRVADARKTPFPHIEFNRDIRSDDDRFAQVVAALGEATKAWARGAQKVSGG
ncbi:hypothetical protein GCM10020367_27950 [Streptomyces sannanensis]|uniref:Resolvase/invertase-type recombinase catalytic domain-containing protein n=1 Tax=Streptomyces sannanensis TaxID=285536 RepID=A0ABP6SB24_9ACTN